MPVGVDCTLLLLLIVCRSLLHLSTESSLHFRHGLPRWFVPLMRENSTCFTNCMSEICHVCPHKFTTFSVSFCMRDTCWQYSQQTSKQHVIWVLLQKHRTSDICKLLANIPPPPPPPAPSGRSAWHRLHSLRQAKFVFPQSLQNANTVIQLT